MSPTWDDGRAPKRPVLSALDWGRVVIRIFLLAPLIFGGLALLLLVRLLERPIWGVHRPLTPHITRFVCRTALRIMGLPLHVSGRPMMHRGAVVSNHSSWIDIFALNASKRIYFVSKSEVSDWPGIGWLARATGTVFIERNRSKAREHTGILETRLLAGHKLLFFPEGTSTDGLQVLPFKTTLFAAFLTDELRDRIWVQPVAVAYHAPPGADPRFYGWWGGMTFGAHLIDTLAQRRQGALHVAYLEPLRVCDFDNRKALAQACERAVREAHTALRKSQKLSASPRSTRGPAA